MSSSILVRRDSANLPAVFLLDTLDIDRGEISVWDAEPTHQPRPVPLSFYRQTRPTSDADESVLVRAFQDTFSPPGGIVLRRRLWKVSPDHANYVAPAKPVQPVTQSLAKPLNTVQQEPPKPHIVAKDVRAVTEMYDKAAIIEKMTAAFANSFAKAVSEAVREAMK